MYSTTCDSSSFDGSSQENGIKIAIADDYPVLLAGMRQSLAPCDDITVLAECTRMSDLLAQVALKKPEVILLGCELNIDDLGQQLHSIAERHWDAKVVVFTGNGSLNFQEVALRNGAKGVLSKQCVPDMIARTIRKVSLGGLCFDRALTDRMLSTFVQRKPVETPTGKGQNLLAHRTGESDHQPDMRRYAQQGDCQHAVHQRRYGSSPPHVDLSQVRSCGPHRAAAVRSPQRYLNPESVLAIPDAPWRSHTLRCFLGRNGSSSKTFVRCWGPLCRCHGG